jgi:hypothetical protein
LDIGLAQPRRLDKYSALHAALHYRWNDKAIVSRQPSPAAGLRPEGAPRVTANPNK